MDTSTGHFWHAKQSQIYTTLKKMESDGLVESRSEPQNGRPDRRVYTITDEGKQRLQAWLMQPVTAHSPQKQELLLKLFFSGRVAGEALLTQLRLQVNLHEQQKMLYRGESSDVIAGIIASRPELKQDALLWEATRRFGEMYEEMFLRWLKETIAMVESNF
jgi:DNA-binding PadR family transcriptional regulator